MAKRRIDLSFGTEGIDKLNFQMAQMQRQLSGNKKALAELTDFTSKAEKALKGFTAAAVSLAGFGGLGKLLASYNKQLFDISKTARITGMNFVQLRSEMENLNLQTSLSKKETAAFFKTMMEQQKGSRLNASATADLARVLVKEYGPALEDIQEGMNDLLSLQQKEINVLRRLNDGLSPSELEAYGAALIMVHGASEKEIRTLTRVASAHVLKNRAQTEDQKKAIELKESLQKLEKAGSDLLIKVAEPLSKAMIWLADNLEKVLKLGQDLAGQKWFAPAAVIGGGAIAAGTAAIGMVHTLAAAKMAKDLFAERQEKVAAAKAAKMAMPGRGVLGGGYTAATGTGMANVLGMAGIRPIAGALPVYVVNPGGQQLSNTGKAIAKRGRGGAIATGGAIAGGALASGLAGKAIPQASGMGRMGRMVGGIGKVAPIAALAGLAAEYGGGMLRESGNERVGSGLQAAGGIAGYAGTGAAIGSMFSPIGTAIGGLIGTITGVVVEFDNLKTAILGNADSDKKSKDAAKEKAKADHEAALAVEEYARKIGEDPKDKEHLLAATIKNILSMQVAQNMAREQGLSGQTAEKFAERTVTQFREGRATEEFTSRYRAAVASPEQRKKAETKATAFLGKTVQGVGIEEAQKLFDIKNVEQTNMQIFQIRHEMEQILLYTKDTTQANDRLAESELKIRGNLSGSLAMRQDSIAAINRSIQENQKMLSLLTKVSKGGELDRDLQQEITKFAKEQLKTDIDIADAKMRALVIDVMIKKSQGEIADLQMQRYAQQEKGGKDIGYMADLEGQRVSLLKSQLELVQAQHVGMGPYLDQVFAVDEGLQAHNAALAEQLKYWQAFLAVYPKNIEAQKNVLAIQQTMTQNERERLEITKNLREGYLDAVQAFTNVEGAFSKFIIDRETGFGEALRRGMAAAGYKTGAIGAGSEEALIKYGPGGSMQFRGAEEQRQLMKGYEAYSPFWPQMMGGAALEQEAGAGEILHGQAIAGQTGARLSQANFMTTEQAKVRFGAYGADTATGVAGIAGTGGIKTLNDNMSNYVTEGINKSILAEQLKVVVGETKAISTEQKKGTEEKPKESPEEKRAREQKQQEENNKEQKRKEEERDRENILKEERETKNKQRQAEVERVKAEAEANYERLNKNLRRTSLSNLTGLEGPDIAIGRRGPGAPRGAMISPVATGRGPGTPGDATKEREQKPQEPFDEQTRLALISKFSELEFAKESKLEDFLGTEKPILRARGGLAQKMYQTHTYLDPFKSKQALEEFENKAPKALDEQTQKMAEGYRYGEATLERFEKRMGIGGARSAIKIPESDKEAIEARAEASERARLKQEKVQPIRILDETTRQLYEQNKRQQEGTTVLRGIKKSTEKTAEIQGKQLGLQESEKDKPVFQPAADTTMTPIGATADVRQTETGFTSLEQAVLGGASDTGWVRFGFAKGGRVPGSGRGDSVPAMLTPGEFVINQSASRAHAGLLESLNSNRFATGGSVGPSPALAMGGVGGFSPNIKINVRGDSVNSIMKNVTSGLQKQLNDMMTPAGTTSRYFDISR